MTLKLFRFSIVLIVLAFGIALMAIPTKVEAQTATCMRMGDDMVHCNSSGAGGSSTTDCMAMGPDMMTCNSIGSGGAGGAPTASPIQVWRSIFGDKTRKTVGKMLADGDCEGAFKFAYEKGRFELGTMVAQFCQQNRARTSAQTYAPTGRAPMYGQLRAEAGQPPRTLYQTVDYLARNVAVPFTVDAAAGAVAVTKIEAFDTQLRMNVLVGNPQSTLADVASPANLRVICTDPNFSSVLRLGGSIRLNFVRKNGAPLGTATQTGQSCRF